MNTDLHFSSKRTVVETPAYLFEGLDAEFAFDVDVCATAENAKCREYFDEAQNGLAVDWGEKTCWMNPPYGRQIDRWMRKAYESAKLGALVVCLVPARTDTAWWHKYATRGEVRFFRGRLRFAGEQHSAPFPSAVVIFRPSRVGSLSLRGEDAR